MSKYTATFQIGWMSVDAEGNTPEELISEVERVQDLQCLAQMAAMMGTKKDQKEIGKLNYFLDKYYNDKLTVDDIRSLDVNLSVGSLKCESLTEEADEEEED